MSIFAWARYKRPLACERGALLPLLHSSLALFIARYPIDHVLIGAYGRERALNMPPTPAVASNPIWMRIAGIASIAGLIYICTLIFQTAPPDNGTVLNNWPGGKWHDPMNDCTSRSPEGYNASMARNS